MEEKVLILRMLSEGKITVDEAEKLLSAIGISEGTDLPPAAEVPPLKSDSTLKSDASIKIEALSNNLADAASKFADRMVQFVGGIYEKATDRYKYTNTFVLTPENLRFFNFSSNNCSLKVRRSETSEIRMKLDISSFVDISSFDGIVETNGTGDRFSVRVKFPMNCWGSAELELPERLEEVDLRGSNGKIEISGYQCGILKASSSNAKLEFVDVTAGEIEALTDNAKITFENVKGDYAVLRSSNGKIEMDCCEIIHVNGKTSNGTIKVPCAIIKNNGNYDFVFETSNGGIQVNFNELFNHGFSTDLTTSNGKVNVELDALRYNSSKATLGAFHPIQLRSDNYDTAPAKINIRAKTSNGPISIGEE